MGNASGFWKIASALIVLYCLFLAPKPAHAQIGGVAMAELYMSMIVGLLVWLLRAPQKLALIPLSIKKIGSTISNQDISFGGLIDLFSKVVTPLVDFTTGLGWTDVGLIICMAIN